MTTLKLGSKSKVIPLKQQPREAMTVIRLNGTGGELDRIEIRYHDATSEAIKAAVVALVHRCSFAEGDSITVSTE
jgi:hypothetical protein